MLTSTRALGLSISALLAATVSLPASAGAPPFPQRQVDIAGRGQKVDMFLRELFGQAGLKVKVSSAVTGTIQGRFTGKPGEIWAQMARAFNLLSFYDGSVVRIYASSEIQNRTFSANAPDAVLKEARRLGLIDANNTIAVGKSTLSANGVPFFLEQVEKIAGSVGNRPVAIAVAPPVTGPITPVKTDIISPIATNSPGLVPVALGAGGGRETSPVRSTLVSRASSRIPYEVRIFYLRYARADDTIKESAGRTVAVPGVASVIRGVMGDGCPSETVSSSGNFDIARQNLPRLLSRTDGVGDEEEATVVENRGGRGGGGGCSRDVNGPRIEVDASNNAVLVRDRPEAMSVYEDVISSIDTEPRGVEIEATIIELDTNRLKELGFDFNLNINGLSAVFGGVAVNPTGGFSSPGVSASYLTGSGDAFAVRLTALERNGSARIVQRPRLSTLNNLAAEFDNQIEYFVRVAGERDAELYPITVGMVMRVTPSVVYDGGELRTRLAIEIQDGSPSGLVVDGIPGVKRSRINTNAIIKQGESLLIGGITVESQFDYKSKIPGLGDVPLLGNAFKKRSKGGGRIERLFLITPRVITQKGGSPLAASAPQGPIPLEVLERGMSKVKKGARGAQ